MSRKRQASRKAGKAQISQAKMDVRYEADYVIARARLGEARFVSLGSLVFFYTPNGDAWMLDPQDSLALWLARDGSALPAHIEETENAIAVAWDRQFRIEDDVFQVTDQAGRVTSFPHYPCASIREAIQRALLPQPPG
jgi:hypothetical protein